MGSAVLRSLCLLGGVFLLTVLAAGSARAETRLALVIGNEAYTHVPSLQNSGDDARAMRQRLAATGFDVIYRENADRRTMNRAVDEFVGRLSADTVALIYYAGHGVQLGSANYLLPTDIEADTADDVASDAIDLSRVLERVTATRARFALAIIDACRDNPFRSAGRSLGTVRGLAPSTSADGVMVVYSAGVNQTALDRLSDRDTDPNGVFTREWLRQMAVPGLSVQEVAVRVRQSVASQARSVGHLQTPAVYDQSLGTFEFVPGPPTLPATGAPPQISATALPSTTGPSTTSSEMQSGTASGVPTGPAPLQACDRLGQPPRWKLGGLLALAAGVTVPALDARAARAACAQAMAEWPNETRFVAYAGRAANKAGDFREALRLYRLAASRGDPLAQNNLAAMYADGQGVGRNQVEAARLYRLAADQGYATAMSNLGSLYVFGKGVPHDEKEAVRWWTRAVEAGEEDAQTNLAVMYAQGRGGVPRDLREAARLWRLAAARGDTVARNNLRKMGLAASGQDGQGG